MAASPTAALSIGHYHLVALHRTQEWGYFNYIYEATVTNSGTTAALHVAATITSVPSNVRVIDGDLTFGNVPGGASVRSRDTFTIRKYIREYFSPTSLVWRIGGQQNLAPTANAGLDQTVAVHDALQLDSSGSSDADGDNLTYRWAILSAPTGSTAKLSDTAVAQPTLVADVPGLYVIQLIVNDGTVDSNPSTATVTVAPAPANHPPVITSTPVTAGQVGVAYNYSVLATDADLDTPIYALTTFPTGMSITATGGLITWTPSAPGAFPVVVTVTDGHGGSDPQSYTVTVTPAMVTVPTVIGFTQATASTPLSGAKLTVGTITQENNATVPEGQVISQDPAAGTTVAQNTPVNLVVPPDHQGTACRPTRLRLHHPQSPPLRPR